LDNVIGPYQEGTKDNPGAFLSGDQPDPFIEQFVNVMDEDLNTAGAVGLMFDKVREINKLLDSGGGPLDETTKRRLANDRRHLFLLGRVLGLLEETPAQFFDELLSLSEGKPIDPSEIEKMVEERAVARGNKDWAKSDEIRDRLKEMRVVLEDGPQGTTWRLDV
jgi:cysteinyl-tRNA synthetase